MSLFYLIHFLILIEVIAAILLVIWFQDKIQWCKIKKEKLKIFEKTKLTEIQKFKDSIINLNKKMQIKSNSKLSKSLFEKVLKSLLMDFIVQNMTILKIGQKIRFFKVILLGFILAFSYLETKKV